MDNAIYIDGEFEKWRKMPCYNPFGIDDEDNWKAKAFALYILNRTESKLLESSQNLNNTTEAKDE